MLYTEKKLTIAINNHTVSYIDEGSAYAPTIIFIHGFPFNKSMWSKQVNLLKDKYRVIAYDVRGHGNSDTGIEDFSIELFVNDLIGLMDVLKIDKTILCGLSMGGYIALNAIENHTQRFSRLILCDTNCLADSPESKEKRMKAIENIRKDGVEKYSDDSLKNLFAPNSIKTLPMEVAAIREMIVNTSIQSLCNTLIAISKRKETCTSLNDIKIPTLILVGKEDVLTPPDVASAIHEKIEGSDIHIIDHAGHLSNIENSKEFNDRLIEFLPFMKQP